MNKQSTKPKHLHWFPKHGEPKHIVDSITQWLVKVIAFPPFYILLVIIMTLIIILLPFRL